MSDRRPHGKTLLLDDGAALFLVYSHEHQEAVAKVFPKRANLHLGQLPVPANSLLPRYEALCRELAEAKCLDEVLAIRDKAEAMRAAAKIAKNRQLRPRQSGA